MSHRRQLAQLHGALYATLIAGTFGEKSAWNRGVPLIHRIGSREDRGFGILRHGGI